jgi:hypothetical protein
MTMPWEEIGQLLGSETSEAKKTTDLVLSTFRRKWQKHGRKKTLGGYRRNIKVNVVNVEPQWRSQGLEQHRT